MSSVPIKPGMVQRLSRPMAKFRPVNRKVQPKPASLVQRKTIDAGRRFVGKYTAADLVSGNGAKTRRAIVGGGSWATVPGATPGVATGPGTTTRASSGEARTTTRGVSSEGARVTARGPSAQVNNANTQGAEKVDEAKAELRPDFRPRFVRKEKEDF